MVTTNEFQPFRFLDLPLEIQRLVYRQYYAGTCLTIRYPDEAPYSDEEYELYCTGSPSLSLELTCRAVQQEAKQEREECTSNHLKFDVGTLESFFCNRRPHLSIAHLAWPYQHLRFIEFTRATPEDMQGPSWNSERLVQACPKLTRVYFTDTGQSMRTCYSQGPLYERWYIKADHTTPACLRDTYRAHDRVQKLTRALAQRASMEFEVKSQWTSLEFDHMGAQVFDESGKDITPYKPGCVYRSTVQHFPEHFCTTEMVVSTRHNCWYWQQGMTRFAKCQFDKDGQLHVVENLSTADSSAWIKRAAKLGVGLTECDPDELQKPLLQVADGWEDWCETESTKGDRYAWDEEKQYDSLFRSTRRRKAEREARLEKLRRAKQELEWPAPITEISFLGNSI